MGKFDNIIIVSDIDHTFLADNGSIPTRNLESIDFFKKEGGRFTFATGRSHHSLLHAFPNAAELLNAPGIQGNGSYLYDYAQNKVISSTCLPKESALKIARFIFNIFPDTGMRMLTTEETIYSCINKYIEKEISQNWYQNISKFQDPKDWTGENWCKIVIRDDPDKLDWLREKIKQNLSTDEFELFKSEADFFEIQAKGCDKGRGINFLRSNYTQNGVAPKIYACGDYENDLSMLAAADIAVCPSNAYDKVKKISDMCLCSCNEGVIGDLIDKL